VTHHAHTACLLVGWFTGATTVVRTVYGNRNGFEIKVDMHQGSALSTLLFVIVTEALSREFRDGSVALSYKTEFQVKG